MIIVGFYFRVWSPIGCLLFDSSLFFLKKNRDTCTLLALLLVEYPALFLVKEAVPAKAAAAKAAATAKVLRAARRLHRRYCLRFMLPMCATLKNGVIAAASLARVLLRGKVFHQIIGPMLALTASMALPR
jgi:hypothetical protein